MKKEKYLPSSKSTAVSGTKMGWRRVTSGLESRRREECSTHCTTGVVVDSCKVICYASFFSLLLHTRFKRLTADRQRWSERMIRMWFGIS